MTVCTLCLYVTWVVFVLLYTVRFRMIYLMWFVWLRFPPAPFATHLARYIIVLVCLWWDISHDHIFLGPECSD